MNLIKQLGYNSRLLLYCICIWLGSIVIASPLLAGILVYNTWSQGFWKDFAEVLILCGVFSALFSCLVPLLLYLWLYVIKKYFTRVFDPIQVTYFSITILGIFALLFLIYDRGLNRILAFAIPYIFAANILGFTTLKFFDLNEE